MTGSVLKPDDLAAESLVRGLLRGLLFFALFALTVQLATGVYDPGFLREIRPYTLPASVAALAIFLIVNRLLGGQGGGPNSTRGPDSPILHGLLAFVLSWLALLFFMMLGQYPLLAYPLLVAAVVIGTYILDRGLALGVWLAVGAGIVPLARTAAAYTPVLSPLQLNSIFSGGYSSSLGLTYVDAALIMVALAATLPLVVHLWNVNHADAEGKSDPAAQARLYLATGAVLLASVTIVLAARSIATDSVRVLNHDRHAVREQSVINLKKELRGEFSKAELARAGKGASLAVAKLLTEFSRASQQDYLLLSKDNNKKSFRILLDTGEGPVQRDAKAELARFISTKEQALSFRKEAAEIDLLSIDDRSWYSVGGPPSSRIVYPADSSGRGELVIASTSPEPYWWRTMPVAGDYLAGALYPAFPILFYLWVLAASLLLLLSSRRSSGEAAIPSA